MSYKIDEVLKPALKLRRSQRAKVAAELIASLDGPAEHRTKEAWATELERRIRDIREKRVEVEEWDAARSEIAKALRTR